MTIKEKLQLCEEAGNLLQQAVDALITHRMATCDCLDELVLNHEYYAAAEILVQQITRVENELIR